MQKLRSHITAQVSWLMLIDIFSLLVGAVSGVVMRLGTEEMHEYVFDHLDGWMLLFSGVVIANYLAGSYKLQYTFSRFNLVVTWFFSLAFAVLILSLTSFAWLSFLLGRGVLFITLSVYSILSMLLKMITYRMLFISKNFICRTVIIAGQGIAYEVRKTLENPFVIPSHKVVALIHLSDCKAQEYLPKEMADIPLVKAKVGELGEFIRNFDADLIVADIGDKSMVTREYYSEIKRLRLEGVEVLTPLAVAEIYSGRTPLQMVNEEMLMQTSMETSLPIVRRVKRLVDIIAAGLLIIGTAPVMLFIYALIKFSSPSHQALYCQTRAGQFGRTFTIFKFRTMTPGAEAETGPVWSCENDPRVTRIGRFLRRYRLDELPQLFNIIKGEMSLVGPRPERPEIIRKMAKEIPFYEERLNMVPGLTGWAQVQYPYGSSIEDAKRKLEYDLYYLKHLSLSLDLQIILRTLRIVILGKERTI